MELSLGLNLARLRICTSRFCAVHYLAIPLLIIALPSAALIFLQERGLDISTLVLVILFCYHFITCFLLPRAQKLNIMI